MLKYLRFTVVAALFLAMPSCSEPPESSKSTGQSPSKTASIEQPPSDVPTRALEPVVENTLFPISKETTFFTGPLDDDNFVDYAAAFNEQFAKGVTTETNAAVPLLLACGPGSLVDHPRERVSDKNVMAVCERLGIERLPAEGDYFVGRREYVASKLGDDLSDDEKREENSEVDEDEFAIALKRSWTADEFPLVAGWLKENEIPLALITRGMKRPHFYWPLVFDQTNGRGNLFDSATLNNQKLRNLAYALATRANLALGEGRKHDAWADVVNGFRFARQIGNQYTTVGWLVSLATHNIASETLQRYAESAELSDNDVRTCVDNLDRLPPFPHLDQKYKYWERCYWLDFVIITARLGTEQIPDFAIPSMRRHLVLLAQVAEITSWQTVLRAINSAFDDVDQCFQQASPKSNLRAADQLAAKSEEMLGVELEMFPGMPKDVGAFLELLSAETDTAIRNQRIKGLVLYMPSNTLRTIMSAEYRTLTLFALGKTTLALKQYRRNHGRYPERLAELTPRYLEAVPQDLFAGQPLRYAAPGRGFFLYSVGQDLRDNRAAYSADISVFDRHALDETVADLQTSGAQVERGESGVSYVTLSGSEFDDASVESLLPLFQLPDLSLFSTSVTDRGMAQIANLKGLSGLHIYGAEVTDEGLAHLADLHQLERITLSKTGVTETGIGNLKDLQHLYSLDLRGPQFTDATVRLLRKFPSVRFIDLPGSRVTDTGAKILGTMQSLTSLSLSGAQITDTGLKDLGRLKELSTLKLDHTMVTDAGLKHIASLAELTELDLAYTEVTDVGLEQLRGATRIYSLNLSGTKITDDGLQHLAGRTKLYMLQLNATKVTIDAVNKLQSKLPNCTIEFSTAVNSAKNAP